MTQKLPAFVFAVCLLLTARPTFAADATPTAPADEPTDRRTMGNAYQKLLADENFAGIEKLAAELRSQKKHASDGLWELSLMYQAVHLSGKDQLDADFEAELALMQKWKAAVPASITRPVAEAQILIAYAWKARGGGWANTVSDNGWKLFAERIDRAKEILDEAALQPTRCIHWYAVMQTVALAQDWPRAAYDKLFNQAIEAEPSYETFYFRKATYILPRWHGNEGESAAFAEEAIHLHPAGIEIYARIVWSQHRLHKGDFFATSGYSWDKTKAGFEAMLAAWPHSNRNLQAYCYFACRAKNKELARELFQKNGDADPVLAVWSTAAYFQQCKRWAASQKKSPQTPGVPAPKPVPMPIPTPTF